MKKTRILELKVKILQGLARYKSTHYSIVSMCNKILDYLDNDMVKEDVLEILEHFFDNVNYIDQPISDLIEDLDESYMVYCLGVGNPLHLTGAIVLSKIMIETNKDSKENYPFINILNYSNHELQEICSYYIDIVTFNNIKDKIRSMFSRLEDDVKFIYHGGKDVIQKLNNRLATLYKEFLDIEKETTIKSGGFLCRPKLTNKHINCYTESANYEYFKIRLEIPQELQDNYFHGNDRRINICLINRDNVVINGFIRRSHDEDWDEDYIYLDMKYESIENIKGIKNKKFKLNLIIANSLTKEYAALLKMTGFNNIKNARIVEDNLIIESDIIFDLSKILS